MICLPEEPELVRLGEDHEGLPPLRYPVPQITSSSEGHVTIKRPVIVTNENYAQNNLHTNKISPDIPSHFSSSPSPPTITASSASSAVSSLGSAVMKSKPPTGKHMKLDVVHNMSVNNTFCYCVTLHISKLLHFRFRYLRRKDLDE
jgi:hypothetical protein